MSDIVDRLRTLPHPLLNEWTLKAADEIEHLQHRVTMLKADRDLWIERSNAHALEADRFRVDCINLKGNLFHEKGIDRGDE
jgi:hypothetical protein